MMKRLLLVIIIAALLWNFRTNIKQRFSPGEADDKKTAFIRRSDAGQGSDEPSFDYVSELQSIADDIYTPIRSGVPCHSEKIQDLSRHADEEMQRGVLDQSMVMNIKRLCSVLEKMSLERQRYETPVTDESFERHRSLSGPSRSGGTSYIRQYVGSEDNIGYVAGWRRTVSVRRSSGSRGQIQSDQELKSLFEEGRAQNWIDYLNWHRPIIERKLSLIMSSN